MEKIIKLVIRWIVFIPAFSVVITLFKAVAVLVELWISKQVHEASGWAYFVASTTFTSFWIPYVFLYWLVVWTIRICPKPQVGAIIVFIMISFVSFDYYIMSETSRKTVGVILADVVILSTLGYASFKKNALDD